jgi:uncharacterized protein YjbJ (UPF0337 family)
MSNQGGKGVARQVRGETTENVGNLLGNQVEGQRKERAAEARQEVTA